MGICDGDMKIGKPSDRPVSLMAIDELHKSIDSLQLLIVDSLIWATSHFRVDRNEPVAPSIKDEVSGESPVVIGISEATKKIVVMCETIRKITSQIQ